jgi:hypothetical protein
MEVPSVALDPDHISIVLTSASSVPTPQKTPQTTTNGNYQTDGNGQDFLQMKDYNNQIDTSRQVANFF